MTVNIAWIRKVKNCEELWIVSDSRLSGDGTVWDQCAKLAILPGNRSFISFAGSTNIAYPIMNQVHSTIAVHRKAVLGFMDVIEQKGHILNVINSTIKSIKFEYDGVKDIDLKQTQFIFGGYSWVKKQFVIWKLFYDANIDKFVAQKAVKTFNFGKCIIAGDISKKVAYFLKKYLEEKAQNLDELMTSNGESKFNMEPYEVVRDLLYDKVINANNDFRTIGGAPQLIKIYQHSNAEPIGVFWSNKKDVLQNKSSIKQEGNATLLGRYLQEYENTDVIYMDPFSLEAKRIMSNNFWKDVKQGNEVEIEIEV
ncbi:hypothetical protein ACFW0L_25160 [Priestia megaterium]|uniref:hypothetical protein n=1 Tax=Priestia megaterium TaxID=1404 RepID=UPI0036726D95